MTTLAFIDNPSNPDIPFLVTGSWDKVRIISQWKMCGTDRNADCENMEHECMRSHSTEFVKVNIDCGTTSSQDKSLVSSTEAHSDFVKCVLSIPKLKLLVSSGSDKVVRFWSAHFQ